MSWIKYTDKHPTLVGYNESITGVWPGQKVRIPKGVKVKTTYSKAKDYESKRATVVTVDHLLNGIFGNPESERCLGHQKPVDPTVRWAGRGGYWCEVSINEIEIEAE